MEIQKGFNKIQLIDYFGTHSEVVRQQNRALSISYENNCGKCERSILSKETIPRNDVVAFKCGHVYHEACVPGRYVKEHCGICSVYTDDESD